MVKRNSAPAVQEATKKKKAGFKIEDILSNGDSPSAVVDFDDDRVNRMSEQSLTFDDYDKYAIDLAKYLLGKLVVRLLDSGDVLTGRIVETEAYPGTTDVASHSYRGRTERNKAMFMPAGTCYVYYIYGRQNCVNVSSKDEAGAVLIRALEPIEGHAIMLRNRNRKETPDQIQKLNAIKDVSNGPAKLCQAFNITKDEFNCKPLNIDIKSDAVIDEKTPQTSENLKIEMDSEKAEESNALIEISGQKPNLATNEIKADNHRIPNLFFMNTSSGEVSEDEIVVSTRVGIDGCGKEAAALPLRFYIRNNFFVSVIKKGDS
ncbi:uncharacterized protein LOC142350289 [Convolutriloba macropyga]|uniref:uncharacterized protein LOC142350289 n=1 Tax=Convolutriloba macropyga TaxID=536237 RepID=UPI003F51CC92